MRSSKSSGGRVRYRFRALGILLGGWAILASLSCAASSAARERDAAEKAERAARTALESGGAAAQAASPAFPAEAVDPLRMKVTVDVEIAGIGKDTFSLEGTVAVHRSGPQGAEGKGMRGILVGAALRGTSPVFGDVVAVQSPLEPSTCEYVLEAPGRYRGSFDIYGWFWLPGHNLLVTTGGPVRVAGIASQIPPVGQKAEIVVKDVPLLDLHRKERNAIGTLSRASGEVLEVVKLPQGR